MLQYSIYNSVEISVIEVKKSNLLMESIEHFHGNSGYVVSWQQIWFFFIHRVLAKLQHIWVLLCDKFFVFIIGFCTRTFVIWYNTCVSLSVISKRIISVISTRIISVIIKYTEVNLIRESSPSVLVFRLPRCR